VRHERKNRPAHLAETRPPDSTFPGAVVIASGGLSFTSNSPAPRRDEQPPERPVPRDERDREQRDHR
jgi:hypothetical protein